MNPSAALRCLVILVIALLVGGCATHPGPITFPGDHVRAAAPDESGAIESFDSRTSAEEQGRHQLFYRTPSGDLVALLTYSGEAQVLWSPSGDYAAITRWKGVGDADCLIFERRTRRLTDATAQLEAALPWLGELCRKGRCAVRAVRWTRKGDLEVRIDGSAPGMAEVRGVTALVRIARALGP